MMIRNIILDFDGTIMDTTPVIVSTMVDAIRELGLPARSEDECKSTIGLRLEDIPYELFPGNETAEKEFPSTYRRIFTENHQKNKPSPFPGVIETLRSLHASGYNMAIASSRSHRSLQEFVDEMELQSIFAAILGGDDVKHAKPSPEPVQTLCRRFGWNPDETIVVGDTTFDIEMGKAAGALTCGVTYGNQSRERLGQSHPTAIIDTFSSLIGVVAQMSE